MKTETVKSIMGVVRNKPILPLSEYRILKYVLGAIELKETVGEDYIVFVDMVGRCVLTEYRNLEDLVDEAIVYDTYSGVLSGFEDEYYQVVRREVLGEK